MLERIKELCKKQGITVKELEIKASLSYGAIGHWNKSTPKADALFLVSRLLGVSVEYLLTGESEKAAPEGGVDSQEVREWSAAWDQASPEARAAALAVLRLGARRPEDQDGTASGR